MREEEKNGTTEFEDLDLASYDDKEYMDSDSADNASASMMDNAEDADKVMEQFMDEKQDSEEKAPVEADADASIAAEFEEMEKVLIIDGKKHKERKRRKRERTPGKKNWQCRRKNFLRRRLFQYSCSAARLRQVLFCSPPSCLCTCKKMMRK